MHWILISSSTISQSSAPIRGCYSSYCGSALGSGLFPTLGHSRSTRRLSFAKLDRNLAIALFKTKKNKDYVKTWFFIHYLGFPGRKWFSHLLLFSFWVYWLDPHHISGQGLLLFCQARSSLFRRVNTHPWPARLNEPGSPHVPQKCHCVVSPGPFFPSPRPLPLPAHSVISVSVVMEMRQRGRKMRALTSGSQARQFIWGE